MEFVRTTGQETQIWETITLYSLVFNFFKKHLLRCSIIALQCCIRFCCKAEWTSYTYAYIFSFLDSLPIWVIREHWVEFPVLQVFVHYVFICRMYICQFQSPSASHLSFPLGVHTFVLSICVSVSALQMVHLYHFSRLHITAVLVYSYSLPSPSSLYPFHRDNFCIFIFFVLLMDTLVDLGLAQHWAEVMLRLRIA